MAYITQEYDDVRLIQALYDIRPDVSFGEQARSVDARLEPPTANGRPVLTITVSYGLTDEELSGVLEKSKVRMPPPS